MGGNDLAVMNLNLARTHDGQFALMITMASCSILVQANLRSQMTRRYPEGLPCAEFELREDVELPDGASLKQVRRRYCDTALGLLRMMSQLLRGYRKHPIYMDKEVTDIVRDDGRWVAYLTVKCQVHRKPA